MYICSFCQKSVSGPRLLLIRRREANHPYRSYVGVHWEINKAGKKVREWYDDPGGQGTQIVSEIQVCSSCKQEHEAKN